jgi:hypothetical protein
MRTAPMTSQVAYYLHGQGDGVPVDTAAGLDAVLDQAAVRVRSDCRCWWLSALLGTCPGHSSTSGCTVTWVDDHSRGIPAEFRDPVELARRAAHYFIETQGKLPEVTWSTWDREGRVDESDYGALTYWA